jgi:RNA polymerase sigma-70 factor (ECF subfamily)
MSDADFKVRSSASFLVATPAKAVRFELIRRYEPAIRREARLRLGSSLRPLLDSVDICQSVLGSFFVRAVAGQYKVESPCRLMRLLIEMTRNKIREKARKRRESSLGGHEPISVENPIDPVVTRDLIDAFRKRLSEKELGLWERRRRDLSWLEIAAEVGGSSESVRQQ